VRGSGRTRVGGRGARPGDRGAQPRRVRDRDREGVGLGVPGEPARGAEQ
jgi:hypothetical protein